jgi:hypothetical protein
MWSVPNACREVSWTIVPAKVVDGTVDVSKQASLYFERQRWWLLSEPTSLLRLDGGDKESTLAIANQAGLGATPVGDGLWRVPSANNAPEFFILGTASAQTRRIGGLVVSHVADDPARVERLGLQAMHERAFAYLTAVVPPPASDGERRLLVIWIGIDEKQGGIGGAAGSRSFVANYMLGKPENEAMNASRTLLVVAHEQFHQLGDLVRGSLPALPVWLGESLAQYYGLKALAATSAAESKIIYDRFVNPARPVGRGLLELERRHAANDPTAYPLFYEQGATFWAQVDEALRASTDRGLDPLIPELLRGEMPRAGALPKAFVERLRQALGAKADELLVKYVGN